MDLLHKDKYYSSSVKHFTLFFLFGHFANFIHKPCNLNAFQLPFKCFISLWTALNSVIHKGAVCEYVCESRFKVLKVSLVLCYSALSSSVSLRSFFAFSVQIWRGMSAEFCGVDLCNGWIFVQWIYTTIIPTLYEQKIYFKKMFIQGNSV